jgi:hypothetical protein
MVNLAIVDCPRLENSPQRAQQESNADWADLADETDQLE